MCIIVQIASVLVKGSRRFVMAVAKPGRENDTLEGIDLKRWGLPIEAVQALGGNLFDCWDRFHDCFTTRTRDTSPLAHIYLKGLLLLPDERNYANIARRIIGPEDDGQGLQQFMSDSPWAAQRVFAQIQREITHDPTLRGGVLAVDESGDKRGHFALIPTAFSARK